MAGDPAIETSDKLFVNEATLELIHNRIDKQVKKSFFAWIGAPVGLAGAGAILYFLFSYIPANIAAYIEKDPNVHATLRQAAVKYLDDATGGRKFVKDQVELTVREQIPAAVGDHVKATVAAYFADPQGGRKLVAAQVDAQFATSGKQTIEQQVTAYLTGAEGRRLVQEQVRLQLEPRLASVVEPMKNNAERLVMLAERLPDVTEIEKRSVDHLQEFLRSPAGARFRTGTGAIALTKRIRRGKVYERDAIEYYLDTLRQQFGPRLQHVVIADTDGTFLARIEPGLFRQRLSAPAGRALEDLLNEPATRLSRDAARAELNRFFGLPVDAAIPHDWKVGQALRAPVWRRVADARATVAVVDGDARFIGVTTRERLLASVFDAPPDTGQARR